MKKLHLKQNKHQQSRKDSEWKDRIEYFHPQKVTIVGLTKPDHEPEDGAEGGEKQEQEQGEIEEVTIQRSNGNSFAFKLIKTATVVFENIKVQESRTRVDDDNAFVTTYDESHIILDLMKFTNTDQQFELIKILSYSQVILTNNLFLNSSGSVIVSALYTNMSRNLTITRNVFANEFFEFDIIKPKTIISLKQLSKSLQEKMFISNSATTHSDT
ncbi:MAG: hypothetical protein EZS28_051172 [Streblomastix strix]|uniref:Uncharacterized protein n=1 Tax=Streblomastix strix TaxID=222440 RepID=A0A5J4T6G4_9EUKA|nr:MAG: hypothetical protein EZS28_051172 [Streblomastix strix]